MAASVGSGRPWVGRKTHQGRVIYIAGEGGGQAVDRRIRTALNEWTVDASKDPVPIDIVTPGVIMNTKEDLACLKSIIDEPAPTLIVVDTLSRCFTGDENKQEFMGAFIKAVDHLRDLYQCTILIIHHEGKSKDVRGSTVLTGAVDTSWRLVRGEPGHIVMHAHKLRERDVEGSSITLRAKKVSSTDVNGEVEFDEFGDELTSLVIKPTAKQLTAARHLLKVVSELSWSDQDITYSEWRERASLAKSDFDAALSIMVTYPGEWGVVQVSPGVYSVDVDKKQREA